MIKGVGRCCSTKALSKTPDPFAIFGDANGDGKANAADFASFIDAYGNNSNLAFDFNNDGVVTASDFNQFRLRYGVTI